MFRILTGSKDAYITDKIISNSFRATDANTGQASTIDLFKLYGEAISGSIASPTEISRGLLKFNLDPLRELTGSILDIGHGSVKCTLKLFDTYGGQTCPSNFKLIVFPLSKSFDEGVGRDIVNFSDLDSCNFITASSSGNTSVVWTVSGSNKQGLLGSSNIDIISSGNLNDGNGIVNLWREQTFSTGEEDLSVDITPIISATLKNIIPDMGFRISYSGSQESDKVTRFVKRFSSIQSSDYAKRPRIEIKYDDSIQDHHRSFFFDISGSLFLNNFHRGSFKNILSSSKGRMTGISGSNSLLLTLVSGSSAKGTLFKKIITASQHKIGTNFITGVYSASFSISQFTGSRQGEIRFNSALRNEIKNAGSATFTEIWSSLDETVGFLTGSVIVNSVNRTSFSNQPKRIVVTITNMQPEFRNYGKVKFRVFAEDVDRPVRFKKLPFVTPSQIFTSMFYRIRDAVSGDIIIPFDTSNNSTLCSTDTDGMYFELYMDSLFKGRLYTIDFLIRDQGFDQIFTDVAAKFRVV